MPLREFGGRAAGGALGLQHGNGVTDGFGVLIIVFPIPFGAVPDVVAMVLDPLGGIFLNYNVIATAVTALGCTLQIDVAGARTVMWIAVA